MQADPADPDIERVRASYGAYDGLLQDLIRSYLEDTRDLLALLAEAIGRGDEDGWRAAAHRLRGSSLHLQARRMAELSTDLEHGAVRDATRLLADLRTEFARVEGLLAPYAG